MKDYLVKFKCSMVTLDEYLAIKEEEASVVGAKAKIAEVKKASKFDVSSDYVVKYANQSMNFEEYLTKKEEEAMQCYNTFYNFHKKAI